MTTSKSPRRVLQVAYDAACQALPAHRHRFSPKKFTQPQLLACLVLKEFARLDYRGLAQHLADHPDLGRMIGLEAIPHYTTFQKAAARLLKAAPARALLDAVLARALRDKVRTRRVPLAAVDGTGLESRHVSRYYVKRRAATGSGTQATTYSKYPKVVLVNDCKSHLVLAAVPGRGPASDLVLFKRALKEAAGRARLGTLLADADFDGEWVHEHIRSYGIRSLIPPERGRPSEKPPAGRWRRRMKQRFDRKKYGQRWQAETVNSMIKRRLGSALRARSYWSQCREIILRVITHNVMIVIRVRVFYRAGHSTFLWPNVRRRVALGNMPRTSRASQANYCYHALNRGNARAEVFHKTDEYQAFVALIGEACPCASWATASCPTISTSCSGPAPTATCRGGCSGS